MQHKPNTEARNVESSPGHCCSYTSAKVMVHIRKLVWPKSSQNIKEKDKTKTQPLRENSADSDPNPQLSCQKAAAGIMEKPGGKRQQCCFAAEPAQCLYNTLL